MKMKLCISGTLLLILTMLSTIGVLREEPVKAKTEGVTWRQDPESARESSMFSLFATVNVKPEHLDAFIQANLAVGEGSVREPGCFRYEVLRDRNNSNRFYFYEVFRDEKAAEAHWETPHFKTWWQTVNEEMLDGEIESIRMQTVFPSVEGFKKQKPGLSNW